MGHLLPTFESMWEPPSFPTASRSVTPRLNSRTSFPGRGTSTASMSVSSAVAVEALSAPVSCRPAGTTGKGMVTSRTMSSHLFKCSSADIQTHHYVFSSFLPALPILVNCVFFPHAPTGDPLLPSSPLPFGSCNTWCFVGGNNSSKVSSFVLSVLLALAGRSLSWECPLASFTLAFLSFSILLPAHFVFCSLFIRNS